MKLIVNGEPREVRAQTLADLVSELGYTDMPVATAVNLAVVRKKDRNSTPLHDGDRVEVLVPMQGG